LIERAVFSDPWSERDLSECVRTDTPFLVADHARTIIGYVIARQVLDEAEILNLGVIGARQRQGVGRSLVEAMLARLHRTGAGTVFLEVRDSNAVARRLYAALGFADVGRRQDYYRKPTEDAVILRASI
jgi:ribosomal-protein-alanine N-acetyltransferase